MANNAKVKLPYPLDEFRTALEHELTTIKKNGQSSIILTNGHSMPSATGFWYHFDIEAMPRIPADVPSKLRVGKLSYDVTVVSCSDSDIIIMSGQRIESDIAKATLDVGAEIVIEKLIERIEKNASTNNVFGSKMLSMPIDRQFQKLTCEYDSITTSDLSPEQLSAVKNAFSYDISYIWGPPGTGKTKTIANLIGRLAKENKTVLMVSHTNIAVDGAVDKANHHICKSYDDASYPILRYGSYKGEVSQATLESHVKALSKDYYAAKENLEKNKADKLEQYSKLCRAIAIFVWKENTKIDTLVELNKSYTSKQSIENNIIEELERVKEKHASLAKNPDVVKYTAISSSYSAHCLKRIELNSCIVSSKEQYAKFQRELSDISDEILKHEELASLEEALTHCYSDSEYANRIDRLQKEKQLVIAEKSTQEARKNESEELIHKYSEKGTIGRLLSGKKAIASAEEELKSAEAAISLSITKLSDIDALIRSVSDERSQAAQLHLRISSISVNGTLDSCRHNQQRITLRLSALSMGISAEEAELTELERLIASEQADLAHLPDECFQYSDLSKKIANLEQNLHDVRSEKSLIFNSLTTVLSEEKTYAVQLGEQVPDNISNAIDALAAILSSALNEINGFSSKKQIEHDIETAKQVIENITKEIDTINDKLRRIEEEILKSIPIIATTLTKAFIDEVIQSRKFDTVILDEASIASIPSLWCSALTCQSHLLIVGDFLQLPPICMTSNDAVSAKWLGTDIFHILQIDQKLKRGQIPENLSILRHQHRMEKAFADIVNNFYYGAYNSKLKSNDNDKKRVDDRQKFNYWYRPTHSEKEVRLIDTSALNAWVTSVPTGKTSSRLNCFSAALDVALAFKALENVLSEGLISTILSASADKSKPSVCIITPYKPHADYLNKLIQLEYKTRQIEDNGYIKAGTIHSFQGSEADVVIIDFVVDQPHFKTNLFLPENAEYNYNTELKQMFNVAITRAKFKLVFVCNFKYCINHAKGNHFGKLLNYLSKYETESALQLFPTLRYFSPVSLHMNLNSDNVQVFENAEIIHGISEDISKSQNRVIIYSPFITDDGISRLLPILSDAVRSRGVSTYVITKSRKHTKCSDEVYYQRKHAFTSHGIKFFQKGDMHEKIVLIDGIMWYGSLNPLSYTGRTGETMMRICDDAIIGMIMKAMQINNIFREDEPPKCPKCGSDMMIAEGINGVPYWKCSSCKSTMKVKQTSE